MVQNAPRQQEATISVIVPAHNVGGYIEECLHSICSQTFQPFEVIVIDDGSTDDTGDRINRIAQDNAVLNLISQKNRGLSAARNVGLDRAQGRYVAFVDGDDILRADYLEQLLTGLSVFDAPWAACGVSYLMASGEGRDHSARHDRPGLTPADEPVLVPLKDWPSVVDHFPSAWNKLYRRDFIGGTRFKVGTYFEDHAFFIELAGRADQIVHVPDPLYVQRKQRQGQITAEDSDRVFDQLQVLDDVRGLMTDAKPNAHAGFRRLASRLISERAETLKSPERRKRFLLAADDRLGTWKTSFEPLDSEGISPILKMEMGGEVPLSVILPATDDPSRSFATLETILNNTPCGSETLVIGRSDHLKALQESVAAELMTERCVFLPSDAKTLQQAFNHGLAQASGAYVIFAEPGAVFHEKTLMNWANQSFCAGADIAMSRAENSFASDSCFHDLRSEEDPAGTHLVEHASLHPLVFRADISARVFKRAFLHDKGLRFPPGALAKQVLMSHAMAEADTVVHLADNEVFLPDSCQSMLFHGAQPSWQELVAEVQSLADCHAQPDNEMPDGWTTRLAARALRDGLAISHSAGWSRMRFTLEALRWFWRQPASDHMPNFDRSIGPGLVEATRGRLPFMRVCIKKMLNQFGTGNA